VEIINFSSGYKSLIEKSAVDTISIEALQQIAMQLQQNVDGFYKNYVIRIDREMFATMLKIYATKVDKSLQSDYFKSQVEKYHGDFQAWANDVYGKSIFTHPEKLKALLGKYDRKKAKKLSQDPVYQLYAAVSTLYDAQMKQYIQPTQAQINILMRDYMRAQMLMQPDASFYPDANLTLRVTYGNVKGYQSRDAVYYHYATTDRGLEEKYKAGDEEFDLPENLVKLLHSNDFGRYADKNGELPVAFIASNHTTGGNSGSPVINGNGELIGTNYDRVWEGTMSDIMYDVDRCRNISLDIRYTLFIVDKYAGAGNIIKELQIVE
jgi:hypothetical protein